jgi:hypothetical protein
MIGGYDSRVVEKADDVLRQIGPAHASMRVVRLIALRARFEKTQNN